MFRNVIVGIRDARTGPDALALAVELASADARLTLVHVLDVGGRPAPDSGAARAASQHRRTQEVLTALADGVPTRADVMCVEARSPRRGLHESAARHGADLLVIRATDRDDVDRDLIGDDARCVLEDPPCPVAVASRGYRDQGRAMKRIGVAYDESAESRSAMALARSLAHEHRAELSAFEAVDGPGYAHDSWEMQEDIDVYVTQARHRISALGGVQAEAGFGHHVDELARYAESVDLLVIGAHRYSVVDRLLERSTAQRLADVTATPLLVLTAAVT